MFTFRCRPDLATLRRAEPVEPSVEARAFLARLRARAAAGDTDLANLLHELAEHLDEGQSMLTGQQVRDACTLLGWSRYDLNRRTGLSFQIVDRLLSGGRDPDVTSGEAIIAKDAFSRAGIEFVDGGAKLKLTL